jgi:hypothetical protein
MFAHPKASVSVASAKYSEKTFLRDYILGAGAPVYHESGVVNEARYNGQRRPIRSFPRRTSAVLAQKARALAHPESSRQAIFETPSHQIREYAGLKNTVREAIAGREQEEGDKRAVQVLYLLGQAGTAAHATSTSESSARCARNHAFWVRDSGGGAEGAER